MVVPSGQIRSAQANDPTAVDRSLAMQGDKNYVPHLPLVPSSLAGAGQLAMGGYPPELGSRDVRAPHPELLEIIGDSGSEPVTKPETIEAKPRNYVPGRLS